VPHVYVSKASQSTLANPTDIAHNSQHSEMNRATASIGYRLPHTDYRSARCETAQKQQTTRRNWREI
jgi:hypothetical protein